MSVFARRLRGSVFVAVGLLLVAVLLGLGAYGCGSGDDTTAATEPASAPPTSSDGSSDAADAQNPGEAGADDAQGSSKDQAGAGAQSTGQTKPMASGGQAKPVGRGSSGTAGSAPGKYRAAVRKAKESCPAGISAVQCKATVEKYLDAPAGPSHAAAESEDCLDIMGQAECEALLTAQQAASKTGTSVNVEECLRNPTPECEAALKSTFEAQQEAAK